jgi:transcriptional regulator with AAA-type ATPase domain
MPGEGSTSGLPVSSGQADAPRPAIEPEFRWQALFQRSRDAVFVLNRRRRFLFVNRAWEQLTGLTAAEARGLACRRRALLPQDPLDLVIRTLCCPPPEVLKGRPGRDRRLIPRLPDDGLPSRSHEAARCWDIDFLPLRDDGGTLCILGRIEPVSIPSESPAQGAASTSRLHLPDKLVSLRETVKQRFGLDRLIARLPALRRVQEQARLASRTTAPVFLVGEPGTGKSWLARAIHYLSDQGEGSFAALDCARLPPAALESALFGGRGLDRLLSRGTRYLHDVQRLPRDLQLRLAESLQVAYETPGPRTVASCPTDPEEEVRQQRLLETLHCLLTPLVIRLPPLRERMADLPDLVQVFLERVRTDQDKPWSVAPETWELLRSYSWPGNLRELYAVLRSAASRVTGDHLQPAHLPANLRLSVRMDQTAAAEPSRPLVLDQLLQQAERRLILLALRRAGGNRSRAAELLSIWRPRLLRRMEALGIQEGDW